MTKHNAIRHFAVSCSEVEFYTLTSSCGKLNIWLVVIMYIPNNIITVHDYIAFYNNIVLDTESISLHYRESYYTTDSNYIVIVALKRKRCSVKDKINA